MIPSLGRTCFIVHWVERGLLLTIIPPSFIVDDRTPSINAYLVAFSILLWAAHRFNQSCVCTYFDLFVAVTCVGGAVFSWGRGKRGRLGIETEEDCFEPQPIITFESSRIDSLASSHGITLLISTELS